MDRELKKVLDYTPPLALGVSRSESRRQMVLTKPDLNIWDVTTELLEKFNTLKTLVNDLKLEEKESFISKGWLEKQNLDLFSTGMSIIGQFYAYKDKRYLGFEFHYYNLGHVEVNLNGQFLFRLRTCGEFNSLLNILSKQNTNEEVRPSNNIYISDRADGVRGHYALGRTLDGVTHQFWCEKLGWSSAGTCYKDLDSVVAVFVKLLQSGDDINEKGKA